MSDYDQLDALMSRIINWTDEEKAPFFAQLSTKNYKGGEYLIRENEFCDKIFFINSGLVSIDLKDNEGNSIATNFIAENNFATSMVAFLTKRPSRVFLLALEDIECMVISWQALQWLYENVQEGNKFGRIQFEVLHDGLCKRQGLTYITEPAERYKVMLDMYPGIEKRVSQKVISSFLRIDTAHFSRLKLKKTQSSN